MTRGESELSSVCDLSATQLVNAYGKGDLSPVDAVCAVLDRIKLLDGQLNAFCAVDEEGAVEAALARRKDGTSE